MNLSDMLGLNIEIAADTLHTASVNGTAVAAIWLANKPLRLWARWENGSLLNPCNENTARAWLAAAAA